MESNSNMLKGANVLQPSPTLLTASKNGNDYADNSTTGLEKTSASSPSHQSESTFSPYSARKYNQLPTPQSPNNLGQYLSNAQYTPDSPLPHISGSQLNPSLAVQRTFPQRIVNEDAQTPALSQQTATPESSPFARNTARYIGLATPRQIRPPSQADVSTPKSQLMSQDHLASSSRTAPLNSTSLPGTPSPDSRPTQLSSPFMEKLAIVERPPKVMPLDRSQPDSRARPSNIDVSSPSPFVISQEADATVPLSMNPSKSPPRPMAGGEMDRIRQAILQDRLAHYHDTENRRPEYLKRTKRTYSEVDSNALEEDTDAVVGITESPIKGRRLMLFQETSEESFEESLMAGGYGRYRTADWVRQPQPVLLATPGSGGPPTTVSVLEQAQEPAPPTEKEVRKRKRLTAFIERSTTEGFSKLHPVELEGRGRVLLDNAPETDESSTIEGSPSKKKGTPRRRKKGELSVKDKKAQAFAAAAAGDALYKPNWPDAEFPWRLRTQEREEELKAEEAEKLKFIERFLDRDSDDEEDDEIRTGEGLFGETTSVRRGRGKMVPFSGSSAGRSRQSLLLPSDPADARAALLSKKSVRTLSYRQEKRLRQQVDDESDDEVLCICNGRDDGRELVQCDDCQTWYHLLCIGIRDISELGKEEDPWFCQRCEDSSSFLEPESVSEPTFAPTDDRPRISPSYDAPLFEASSFPDSPMVWGHSRGPRTPTRPRDADVDRAMSSSSSWVGSSRHKPITPQQGLAPRANISSTPGPYDSFGHYDEPFDPTSTPSRGIKFSAPFATPKTTLWSSRANGLFQTPLKTGSDRSRQSRGSGLLLDESGHASYGRSFHDEESPIRRVKSQDGPKARRIMDSPLASRSSFPAPLLEESPIMRHRPIEQQHHGPSP